MRVLNCNIDMSRTDRDIHIPNNTPLHNKPMLGVHANYLQSRQHRGVLIHRQNHISMSQKSIPARDHAVTLALTPTWVNTLQ